MHIRELPRNRRVLVADDLASIHEDFRKSLQRKDPASPPHLGNSASLLFPGSAPAPGESASTEAPVGEGFELSFALQGEEAVAEVARARAAGEPYAVAFVDVRMPPGIDGVETASLLRTTDPELQVVLCTAYSDYTLAGIHRRLGAEWDGLVVLKKPFDPVEVYQLATSLSLKWCLARAASLTMEELEAKVRARTAELASANQSLSRAWRAAEAGEKAKRDFLACMSHELRTPLNGVIGSANLLREILSNPEDIELADTIHQSGAILLGLLEKILRFTELEQGSLHLDRRPFSLQACLRDIVEEHRSRAQNLLLRGDLRLPEGLQINSDESGIIEVLRILVGNALKFTQQGSVVVSAKVEGSVALIEVADTGPGMTRETAEKLWTPFFQADTSISRKHNGAGLSLALARRIVEHLGGDIGCRSKPGEGSVFWVRLPLL